MGLFSFFKKKEKKTDEKYKLGMHKTRDESFGSIKKILAAKGKIDDELFDELEEVFIKADIGVDTVIRFVDGLRDEVQKQNITDPNELQEVIIDKMFEMYLKGEIVNANLNLNKNGLSVILFVGVNGVGKTTSIAKVAHQLKESGKRVLIAAGDTFRAGAIEQIAEWGRRLDVPVITHEAGSDPSSVIFDAIKEAKDKGYDVLLCDTAGRLQNKVNLMNELAKIKRVISREVPDAPQEILLTIDATTGQNGMMQAKVFLEVVDVTGIILTKLDGTAKGGIVLAIRNELNIPIKYVGLGEKIDDLEPFDIEQYLYGLFADFFE